VNWTAPPGCRVSFPSPGSSALAPRPSSGTWQRTQTKHENSVANSWQNFPASPAEKFGRLEKKIDPYLRYLAEKPTMILRHCCQRLAKLSGQSGRKIRPLRKNFGPYLRYLQINQHDTQAVLPILGKTFRLVWRKLWPMRKIIRPPGKFYFLKAFGLMKILLFVSTRLRKV
jgi:hypothetical protein